MTCSSNGQPNPSFTIIHNRKINITGIEETHIIPNVTWDDAGYYTCVAINELGSNSSDPEFLDVKGTASCKDVCAKCIITNTLKTYHYTLGKNVANSANTSVTLFSLPRASFFRAW